MTKITTLNKAALVSLRDPIEKELAALGERLGLKFEIGNGKFGAGAEATFQLKMTVDDPAIKEAAARAKWDANCRYIGIDYNKPDESGLRPEDFGTEFEMNRTRYRETHLALNRTKYPVGCEVLSGPKTGQSILFTEAAVPVIRAATDAAIAADKTLPGFTDFANAKRAEAAG